MQFFKYDFLPIKSNSKSNHQKLILFYFSRQGRQSTVEKLPPINTDHKRPRPMAAKNDPKMEKKAGGSSVPKLPKLLEDDQYVQNDQLAKVHRHLESVEDQDKIFVIEVKP